MSTKTFVAVVAVILFGAAFAVSFFKQSSPAANESTNKTAGNDSLAAEHSSYDFGTISMKDGKVKHVFKLENTGQQPVTVSRVYSSCMCTEVSISIGNEARGPFGMLGHGDIPSINLDLARAQTALVEAVFDPNAHGPAGVGDIERSVFAESPGGKKYELKFKAKVTP
jgi:hypothetical protein